MPLLKEFSLEYLVISIESILIIYIFIKMLNKDFIKWILTTNFERLLYFIFSLIALFSITQLTNNLGHLIRLKSIPIFILYIIFILYKSSDLSPKTVN